MIIIRKLLKKNCSFLPIELKKFELRRLIVNSSTTGKMFEIYIFYENRYEIYIFNENFVAIFVKKCITVQPSWWKNYRASCASCDLTCIPLSPPGPGFWVRWRHGADLGTGWEVPEPRRQERSGRRRGADGHLKRPGQLSEQPRPQWSGLITNYQKSLIWKNHCAALLCEQWSDSSQKKSSSQITLFWLFLLWITDKNSSVFNRPKMINSNTHGIDKVLVALGVFCVQVIYGAQGIILTWILSLWTKNSCAKW